MPTQQPLTICAGFYDSTVRRLFSGDVDWDGDPIAWGLRTPEVFGKAASDPVYFRRLSVRGRGAPSDLSVTVTIDGVAGPQTLTQNFTVEPMGGNEFVAYTDVALTGLDGHAEVTGTGVLEIQSIDWSYIPKPGSGLVVSA